MVTGAFGVDEEKENGETRVDFFAEREKCVRNTFFHHRGIHK